MTNSRDVPGTCERCNEWVDGPHVCNLALNVEAIAWIDAILRQERKAFAAERRGSSQWLVIQENINHFEYVRERLWGDRRQVEPVNVTNRMIRAGREASRKHGAGAMREIYTAMVEAQADPDAASRSGPAPEYRDMLDASDLRDA